MRSKPLQFSPLSFPLSPTLHDPTQLHGTGEDEAVTVTEEELGLVGQLIDAAPREIRWSAYRDDTADRLAALVEAKLHGHTLPTSVPNEPAVMPVLDTLQQSLNLFQGGKPPEEPTSRRHRKR